MLLVHHFGSGVNRLGDNGLESWGGVINIQRIFVPFFMQSFFLLSGYCSNFAKTSKQFWISIFKQIILPLAFFELLRKVCDSFIYDDFSIFTQYYTTIDLITTTTLWFLYALLFSKIILYYINVFRIPQKYQLLLLLVLLCLGIFLNQYNIGLNFFYYKQALGSAIFVGVGNFLKNKESRMQWLMGKSLYIYPWLLILSFLYPVKIPAFTASMDVKIWEVPIFLLSALCGTFWLLKISQLLEKSKFLQFFGQNTLIVYGAHFILLEIIMRTLNNAIEPKGAIMTLVYMALVYILLIPSCLLTIKLFNSKYLRWTIGKF